MNARRSGVLWKIVTVAVCLLTVITIGSCQIDCSRQTRFSCSDGTCMSKAKECNGKRDCAGGEDELECDVCCPDDPSSVLHRSGSHVARNACGRQSIVRRPPYNTSNVFNYVCKSERTLQGHLPTWNNGNWSQELPKCIDYDQCGQSRETRNLNAASAKIGRVVEGGNLMEVTWPWFALITRKSSTPEKSLERDNLHGGASIINKNWILTAAHVLHGLDLNDYVVFVGLSKRPSEEEFLKSSVKMYSIADYVEHPHYAVTSLFDSDLALIKLGQKLDRSMQPTNADDVAGLTFGPSIRAICLPGFTTYQSESNQYHLRCPWSGMAQARVADHVIVVGFGHTDAAVGDVGHQDFNPPKKLQQATVRVKEQSWCQQQLKRARRKETDYSKRRLFLTENMICCKSDQQSGRNACDGDSGGPLMKEIVDEETRISYWVQIGIVSFGFGCQSAYPAYFTKVEKYTSWIQDVISNRKSVSECPLPDSPVNGNVTWNKGRRGSTACYSCFEGYTLDGSKCRTCNADRRWGGRTPSCEDYNEYGQSGEKRNVHAASIGIGLVVGGADAMEGTWPWFALITRMSSTQEESLGKENLVGGGSIINKNWILTAAALLRGRTLHDFVVVVGLTERPFRQEFVKSYVEMYSITKYVEHPEFNMAAPYDSDIALIKIGQKLDQTMQHTNGDDVTGLTFGPNIRAIRLPGCTTYRSETNQNGLHCPWSGNLLPRATDNRIIIGFGHTYGSLDGDVSRLNFHPPKKLQQATVKIKEPSWCRRKLERERREFGIFRLDLEFTENMVCCGSDRRNRKDACAGDSGGPLMKEMVNQQTGTSYWVQIGIISFGIGCASRYPGYYTKVERFTSWIQDTISDFAKCGQARKIGSYKRQATLARAIGGENAVKNAWPWQALITRADSSIKQSLRDSAVIGGGSILNQNWLLTAAHLLMNVDQEAENWLWGFVVIVGISERPRYRQAVQNSVEAYSMGQYLQHSQFNRRTLINDIALIKLGEKLDRNLNAIEGETDGLSFGYYIRPVCLPCTGTCLKKNHLYGDDRVSLINDEMDSIQICQVEEKLLHSHDPTVIVTGFGHLNIRFRNQTDHNILPKQLQQALIEIEPEETCRQGIREINAKLALDAPNNPRVLEYADSMICCKSGIPGRVVDTCEGDSGGPMVREVLDKQTGESCWVQIGIVSFGYGCGLNFPGYYTNVARFIPWINETIGGILPGP